MPRQQRNRPQHLRRQFVPVLGEWPEHPSPLLAVLAERALGLAEIALQNYRRAIVQGMRQRRRWLNPFQSVIAQRQRREERRGQRHGMHGRAEVVLKSGKSKGKRTSAAAGLRLSFVDLDLQSRLRQNNGRGQAVGTCSDDHGSARGCGHRNSVCERDSACGIDLQHSCVRSFLVSCALYQGTTFGRAGQCP